jgi:amino acid permease
MLASRMAWNAVFLAEPRYMTAFRILAVGIIVQVIIFLVNRPAVSSVLHMAQAVILWALLLTTPSVLHPDNPILRSVPSIQFFFGLIVLAFGVAALQVARLISSFGARLGSSKKAAIG